MTTLNPLGFFWDIENCPVPWNKQTLLVVEKLRQKFNYCGPETDFICVCDVTKERLEVIEDLNAGQVSRNNSSCKIVVYDLPSNIDINRIRERLNQLSSNCGGRVVNVNRKLRTALLRFTTPELTSRALKRMQNEDVFGCRISVQEFRSTKNNNGSVATSSSSTNDAVEFTSVFTFDQIKKPTLVDFAGLKNDDSCKDFNNKLAKNNSRGTNFAAAKTTSTSSSSMKLNHTKSHSPSSMATTTNFRSRSGRSLSNSVHQQSSSSYQQNFVSSPTKNSVSSKRNLMTDKLKQALGFQSKNNPTSSSYYNSNNPNNFNEEIGGVDDLRFDCSFDLTPVKLKPSPNKCFNNSSSSSLSTPVDVRVENLDTSIPIRYLKQNLYFVFSSIVRVLHVTIVPQSEGGWYALIQVQSKNDAQEAVNRLNQTKIGQTHLVLSVAGGSHRSLTPPVDELKRRQACSLLNSVTSKSLPLEKFLESYDKKFGSGISVTEIEQMAESLKLVESAKGLRVSVVNNNENSTTTISPTYPTTTSVAFKRCFTSSERRKSRLCICTKPVVNDGSNIVLTPKLLCCMIRDQMLTMLNKQPNEKGVPIVDIPKRYAETFGTPLAPNEYGYADLKELLTDLEGFIEQVETDKGVVIKLRDGQHYQATLEQILYLFLPCPDKELTFKELQNEFRVEFGFDLPIANVQNSLSDILEFFEGRSRIIGVRLTPVQKFALRIRRLLLNCNGDVLMSDLERSYQTQYGEPIRSQNFGFPSLIGLLRAASHVLYLKGRGHSLTVCINRNFLGSLKNDKNNIADVYNRCSSGFEANRRRTSPLGFVTTTTTTTTTTNSTPNVVAKAVEEASPDILDNNKPLATSSPPPEMTKSSVNNNEKFVKIADDGPFAKFLQDPFLFSSRRIINDDDDEDGFWWSSTKNNYSSDDAKLTNSSSTNSTTTTNNFGGVDDFSPSSLSQPATFISDEFRQKLNVSSSCNATPTRRSRLAVKFLNV